MRTEIERQFFDTFGIEKQQSCSHSDTCYNGSVCNDCEGCNAYNYPQITDRILLKLICIIGKKPFGYLQCENTYSTNLGDTKDLILVEADDLKEGLLTLAIQKKVVLRIKQQVQALFKGNDNV